MAEAKHGGAGESAEHKLIVRPIQDVERDAWRWDMAQFHYLGECNLVGESLRYVAVLGSVPVAWLGWAGATMWNGPRDEYIGWEKTQKRQRLHLVVNNARFLMLPGAQGRVMASQVLGANLRRLSADWQQRYGHQVLLAETFVDARRFRGTCYRAANWRCVGQTQGFSRRGTSYEANGAPKLVFVYGLEPHACELLSGGLSWIDQPYRGGVEMLDLDRFPLAGDDGLLELLGKIVDPRKRRGVRHPLLTVVAISVCATIAGAKSYAAIAEWAVELSRKQLRRFGSQPGRSAPSEPTIRRVLQAIDAAALDRKLNQWMRGHSDLRGKAVAIDGKTVRGSRDGENKAVHLVSAVVHGEGVVVAQHRVPDKTNEITSVEPLFEDVEIEGAVITGDAMFTQKTISEYLVGRGADYVWTVKDNQPSLRAGIEALGLGAFPPQATTVGKDHARIEERKLWASSKFPNYQDFPHVAQVFRVERTTMNLDGSPKRHEVVYGISSLDAQAASPDCLLDYNRGHWGIENKVHWVRDVTFDEDRSQIRKHAGAHVMATIRNFAISVLRLAGATNIAAALRYFARNLARPMTLFGII